MANLSNINGKFVVEQTTGFVGIGTTDPAYLLHVNSSDITNGTRLIIENTNGSGKKYGLISDNTGVFTFRDVTASADRFSISNLGNATFAGNLGIGIAPLAPLQVKTATNLNLTVTANGSSDVRINAVNDAVDATVPLEFNATNYEFLGTGNSTFAGAVSATGVIFANRTLEALGQNLTHGASRIKICQENTTKSQIRYYGADASTKGSLEFMATTSDGSSSVTPLSIDSSGNVGIGTVSPDAKLHIYGSSSLSEMYLGEDAAADKAGILKYTQGNGSGTGVVTLSHWGNNSLTEGLAIKYGGNVGIGTTSPEVKLSIDYTAAELPTSGTTSNSAIQLTSSLNNQLNLGLNTVSGNYGAYIQASDNNLAVPYPLNLQPNGGNVGIGTTSPGGVLHIKGNGLTQNLIRLQHDGTGGNGFFDINVVSDKANLVANYSSTPIPMRFITGAAERMRITSGGEVLINQTVASTTANGFGVHPTGSGGGNLVSCYNGTGNTALIIGHGAYDGTIVDFRRGSTQVGTISVSTSATQYNTSSDYRLKENVVEMTGALNRVSQLKPSRFNFIADADKTVDGFLAHEVQEIVPEAITGEKDAVDEDGNPDYQGIDQSKLVPLLVGAIQELEARIKILENK